MQKGFAHPGWLLIIIILFGVSFFIFGSKQSKLESLKAPLISSGVNKTTYTNQNLGFQFEYSETHLKVIEDTEEEFNERGKGNFRKNFKGYIFYEPGKFLGATIVLDKDDSYETNPFTVWVFDNPEGLDVDGWYKDYWYYPFVWGDFTSRRENVSPVNDATVSGQMAKSGIVDYQPGKPKFTYIPKDGKMYLLRVIGDEGEKILGSFKFL